MKKIILKQQQEQFYQQQFQIQNQQQIQIQNFYNSHQAQARKLEKVPSSSSSSNSRNSNSSNANNIKNPISNSTNNNIVVPEINNYLYPELLLKIFKYLSANDLRAVPKTCKYWKNLTYGETSLWRNYKIRLNLKNQRNNGRIVNSLITRGILKIQVESAESQKLLNKFLYSISKSIKELYLSGLSQYTEFSTFSNFHLKNYSSSSTSSINTTNICLQKSQSDHNTLRHSLLLLNNCQVYKNLTILCLSYCKSLTDFDVCKIIVNSTNLFNLDLSGCSNLTDRALLMIFFNLKKLENLVLKSCKITETGLCYITGDFDFTQECLKHQDFLRYFFNSNELISVSVDNKNVAATSSYFTFTRGQSKNYNNKSQIELSSNDINLKSLNLKRDNLLVCVNNRNCKRKLTEEEAEALQTLEQEEDEDVPLKKRSRKMLLSINQILSASIPENESQQVIDLSPLKLKKLNLQDCQKVTDESLGIIANKFSSTLIHLNLNLIYNISDSGIKFLNKLENLQNLEMKSCENITSLRDFGNKLKKLDISFCDKMKDLKFNSSLIGLKELNLNGNTGINDDSLLALFNCSNLETLNLGQTIITDVTLKNIHANFKFLRTIDLYGCSFLSKEGIENLINNYAKINIELNVKRGI